MQVPATVYHMQIDKSEAIAIGKVALIAKEFFKQSFSTFEIVDIVLQDSTWYVKALVASFGVQSDRVLAIDSITGRIISCK